MPIRPSGPTRHLYSGPYIDRGGDLRKDPDWIAAALASNGVCFVPVWGTKSLLRLLPEPCAVLYTRDQAASFLSRSAPMYLGQYQNAHCFALELDQHVPPEGAEFVDLRLTGGMLEPHQAGLLAYARALVYWRGRHRFCGSCASPMLPGSGGTVMSCSNERCGAEIFPRLDPAIIVLVTDGDRALLGRQASWPPHRYSTLAGFVEPGESLEDAVVREVAEEAGVTVTAVSYHSSQPWPFPSSLMLGFIGAADRDAKPQAGEELEDARWFTREELAAGPVRLSPPMSISYRLIEAWYEAEAGRSLSADLARRGSGAHW